MSSGSVDWRDIMYLATNGGRAIVLHSFFFSNLVVGESLGSDNPLRCFRVGTLWDLVANSLSILSFIGKDLVARPVRAMY